LSYLFDGAKVANDYQISVVFPFFLIGKCLFEILKCPFDVLLFHFPLIEPLFAEGDAEAKAKVVLLECTLLHGGSVEVWNVCVCPLYGHVELRTGMPLREGDGETCRNAELVRFFCDGACRVGLGVSLRIVSTDLVGAALEDVSAVIGVRCPIQAC